MKKLIFLVAFFIIFQLLISSVSAFSFEDLVSWIYRVLGIRSGTYQPLGIFPASKTTTTIPKPPTIRPKLSYSSSIDVFTTGIVPSVQVLGGRVIEVSFSLNLADVSLHKMEGYDYLQISDFKPSISPGEPMLPMKIFVVTLPKNSKILGVQIIDGKFIPIVNKLNIVPGPELIFWHNKTDKEYKRIPKKEIYSLNTYFPGKFITYDSGNDNKNTYVLVRLKPVQYIPAQGKAILLSEATIRVNYLESTPSKKIHLTTYANNIILCKPYLCPIAQELADFHNSRGMSTDVVDTDWIYTNYPEAEDPPYDGYKNSTIVAWENITNYNYSLAKSIVSYLRDQAEHPNLEYVTLFGNALNLPPSYYYYVTCFSEYESWIPTDFYYTSPDYDEVPNFKVGRIPVNNTTEAEHVVQKIKNWYGNLSWDWFMNVALVGGKPHKLLHYEGEMGLIDSVNRGFFESMNITKFFQSDGNLIKKEVNKTFQGSFGVNYILTHSAGSHALELLRPTETQSSNMWGGNIDRLNVTDLMSLSPNPNVSIVLSPACGIGAFDNNIVDFPGRVHPVSFGEGLLLSNAGGIAFVGGSRPVPGVHPQFYLEEGYLHIIKESAMVLTFTNMLEAYHNGTQILGNLTTEGLWQRIIEDGMYSHEEISQGNIPCANLDIMEFTLLGDPTLELLPQQQGVVYDQPNLTTLDYSYLSSDLWPTYENIIPMNITSTTNSSTVTFKPVKILHDKTFEYVEKDTVNNNVNYSFSPDISTYYNLRAISEDGKEGWLYLAVLLPIENRSAITCDTSPCIASSDLIRSRDSHNIQEPNTPNTIDGHRDGMCWRDRHDPDIWVENITIKNLNASTFRTGDYIQVETTVSCLHSLFGDIYFVYTNDSINPKWKTVERVNCQDLFEEYGEKSFFNVTSKPWMLDYVDGNHTVRVSIQGSGYGCQSIWNDNDDVSLVIEYVPPPTTTTTSTTTTTTSTSTTTLTTTTTTTSTSTTTLTTTTTTTILPIITISSPVNNFNYSKLFIPLNFTIDVPILWVNYSLDDKTKVDVTDKTIWNETHTVGSTKLENLVDGYHSIIVHASNSFGNIGYSDPVYFFYCLGDINHDKKVDIKDIAMVAKLFGAVCGDGKYDPDKDLNDDCKIDIKDIAMVAKEFGKICQ